MFGGYYINRFKQGGRGVKFTKWTTVRSADDQRQAELLWEEFNLRRNKGLLERYRVTYKGKVVVNDRGSVYETVKDDSAVWVFVKKLEGAEEL
jgi:hypothetical protein